MDKQYFIELLRKQQAGTASKTELQFILSYYNLFEAEKDMLSFLPEDEKNRIRQRLQEGIRERIASYETPVVNINRRRSWKIALSAAAAVAVVFFSVRIFLPDNVPVISRRDSGLTLIRNSNHMISLPDGSTVTLSSGSKLNYGAAFNTSGKREVVLDGQAFFDVKHDSSRPFIVHAGKVNVTVLGTAFNIKAFQLDGEITVTVKRGRVRVSDENKTLGTITPHEQIIYNKNNQNATQVSVKTDSYIQWKELDCLFDNLTITEVATLLEERFAVKIMVDKQLSDSERFTATFPKNESLEQALKSICEFNDAIYKYDKETGIVQISKK